MGRELKEAGVMEGFFFFNQLCYPITVDNKSFNLVWQKIDLVPLALWKA